MANVRCWRALKSYEFRQSITQYQFPEFNDEEYKCLWCGASWPAIEVYIAIDRDADITTSNYPYEYAVGITLCSNCHAHVTTATFLGCALDNLPSVIEEL